MDNLVPRNTVLLVEDSADDEALSIRAMRKSGIPVLVKVARTGDEALDALIPIGPSSRELPQFVLLDLKLPGVDGKEVLRRLRANEETAMLPVVVLSSSDEDRDRTDCYRLGANSYIRKPIDFAEYVSTVGKAVQYWLAINRVPEFMEKAGTKSFSPI